MKFEFLDNPDRGTLVADLVYLYPIRVIRDDGSEFYMFAVDKIEGDSWMDGDNIHIEAVADTYDELFPEENEYEI